MKYKTDDILNYDFEHDQEFMKVEDVIFILNAISAKLEDTRFDIKKIITDLESDE